MDGDVSGVVASFKTSRILCLASSRNERLETFLALPARSFVAANERLNMVSPDVVWLIQLSQRERELTRSFKRAWWWFDRRAAGSSRVKWPSNLMICGSGDEREDDMARGRSYIYVLGAYPCLCVCLFACRTCKCSASRPEQAWLIAFSRE